MLTASHKYYEEARRRAAATFDDAAYAVVWLDEPSVVLGGARPVDLLTSASGLDAVLAVLVRIEHGIPP